MKIFIKAENYQVWRAIEIADFEIPTANSNNEIFQNLEPDMKRKIFKKWK